MSLAARKEEMLFLLIQSLPSMTKRIKTKY